MPRKPPNEGDRAITLIERLINAAGGGEGGSVLARNPPRAAKHAAV